MYSEKELTNTASNTFNDLMVEVNNLLSVHEQVFFLEAIQARIDNMIKVLKGY